MAETKKLKRTALVLFGVISALFLVYLIRTGVGIVSNIGLDLPPPFFPWNTSMIINTIIGFLIFSAIFLISLTFLLSIRKGESPFNRKTVKNLKILSILLIIFEIQNMIAQYMNPIVLFDGYLEGYTTYGYDTLITMTMPLGGFVVAAGLVIYCVALILEHGICLQTQVDETL